MSNRFIVPLLLLVAAAVAAAALWPGARRAVAAASDARIRAVLRRPPAARLAGLARRLLEAVLDSCDRLVDTVVVAPAFLLVVNSADPLVPHVRRNLRLLRDRLNAGLAALAAAEEVVLARPGAPVALELQLDDAQPLGRWNVIARYPAQGTPQADAGASHAADAGGPAAGVPAGADDDPTPAMVTPTLVLPSSRQVPLTSTTVTAGRAADCSVVLDDALASKRHVSFTRTHDDGVLVEDLGSTNGTRIGDALVRSTVLYDDAEVVVARDTVLRVVFRGTG